jgi:hypothetical protein
MRKGIRKRLPKWMSACLISFWKRTTTATETTKGERRRMNSSVARSNRTATQ